MTTRRDVTNTTIYLLSRIPDIGEILRQKWPAIPLERIKVHGEDSKRLDHLSPDDEEKLQNAEIIFADTDYAAHFNVLPPKYNNIKFMQVMFVGVNNVMDALDKQYYNTFTLAHVGGCMGNMIGEYTLGHIIAYERSIVQQNCNQKNKIWNQEWGYRMLDTLSIGILGLGDLGKVVASHAKAFGMEIWALVTKELPLDKRNPCISQYCVTSQLPELLSACDYVVNLLPSTPKTRGLLDGEMLKNCENKRSVFINIGRGDIVKNETIVKALDNGWLRHVICDVFEVEPLPVTSALWDRSDVTITPHTAAYANPRLTSDLFISNYKKFLAGEKVAYTVDWEKGF